MQEREEAAHKRTEKSKKSVEFNVSALKREQKFHNISDQHLDSLTGQRAVLKCPGGPRPTRQDLRMLHRVPSNGKLKENDVRFILNLKLTHILMKFLSRHPRDDRIYIELGCGVGSLTRSLLTRRCMGVLGLELDPLYNPQMAQVNDHTPEKFKWLNADALHCDEGLLVQLAFGKDKAPWVLDGEKEEELSSRLDRMTGRMSTNSANEDTDEDYFDFDAESGDTDPQKPQSAAQVSLELKRLRAHNTTVWHSSASAGVEVIGNLPFTLSSQIVQRYAVDCSQRRGVFRYGRVPIHLFVQKGVADRFSAIPSTNSYGKLSVMVQNYFHVQTRATFVETTFFPDAEVEGALLTLEPRTEPLVPVEATILQNFLDLVLKPEHRGFGVLRSLELLMPSEVAKFVVAEVGLDHNLTSKYLTVKELASLAMVWGKFLTATNQPQGGKRQESTTNKGARTYEDFETLLKRQQEAEERGGSDYGRDEYEGRDGASSTTTAADSTDSEPASGGDVPRSKEEGVDQESAGPESSALEEEPEEEEEEESIEASLRRLYGGKARYYTHLHRSTGGEPDAKKSRRQAPHGESESVGDARDGLKTERRSDW